MIAKHPVLHVYLLPVSILTISVYLTDCLWAQDTFFAPVRTMRAASPQPGQFASYGSSIAAVDYDGDSWLELTVGAWREDLPSGQLDAGLIFCVDIPQWKELNRISNPIRPSPKDYFGFSQDWGDVTNDGQPDLIVGMPGRQVGSAQFAGQVLIFTDFTFQELRGLQHTSPQVGDYFGASIVTADIHATPGNEIIVGTPYYGESDAGQVLVFTIEYQDSPLLTLSANPATAQGHFGISLAQGDFNGDGVLDLAVGSDGISMANKNSIGAVDILYGPDYSKRTRVSPAQDASLQTGLQFGRCIAAGDINNDGFTDLAVGRPGLSTTSTDGTVDLILAPDFTRRQRLSAPGAEQGRGPALGFGNAVALTDLDRDGQLDLIVGAIGTASPFDPNVREAGEIVLYLTSGRFEPVPFLPGDMNRNERREAVDAFLFATQWKRTPPSLETADLHRNGQIDTRDAAAFTTALRSIPSDLDGDGSVDVHDAGLISNAWLRARGTVPGTDLDESGFVDRDDLRLFSDFARTHQYHR